ncbi:MAG: hypothetical protein ACD_39C01959G0001 [uncultured bacterium]|nr:MAG: hypothetical protein ACD_39C01959G0001 [uncultured bacterium]
MPLLRKRNLVLFFVIKILVIGLFISGCQEGTNKSPVSALLTGLDANQATVDLTSLGDAVAKHNILGNVVSQNTGEKLANIAVNLFYESQLAATTKTTSDGQFYFTKVPSGLFDLTFFSTDNTYASAAYVLRVLDNGKTSPENPEVKMFALNPGQIKIQAKIEGEVMLSGTGTKLANINVELESNGSLISTALTGPLGQFAFSNLGTGTYIIKAGKASNYEEGQQPVLIRDDGVVSPRYTIVSLTSKPIENFAITGYVRSQNKEAIAYLMVEIFDDADLTRSSYSPAYTTGEGKFFFQGLKEARMYFLRASAGTNTEESDPYPVKVMSDGTTSPAIPEILVIRNEESEPLEISGKVYDAFTGGPLEYVSVKIGNGMSTLTDKNGKYIFSDLLPGTYKIGISKFGYETLDVSFQLIEDSSGATRTIPASMSYPLLHDMKTGYGSIAGRIINEETGTGRANLTVRAYKWKLVTKTSVGISPVITETDWQWEPSVVLSTRTSSSGPENVPDLAGSFKLTHLAPGDYLVYIASDSAELDNFEEDRGGFFDWNVPMKWTNALQTATLPNYVAEIRGLRVEDGKTTYWTNYEQEYK